MIEVFLQKLRRRDEISADEEGALRVALGDAVSVVPARTIVVRRDEEQSRSKLLLDGFIVRHKELRNGERQVLETHVPGDFVDLHSLLLKRIEHDVSTLSESRILNVPHSALIELITTYPHLGRVLWFSTLLDASVQREAMLSLGRRSSVARLAHTFCELQLRLASVGMATPAGYTLPFSQIDLSEVAGITPVHVNRMLRELRERGLMTFKARRVDIHDLAGLRALAEFTEDYLYLEPRRR